MFQSPIAQPAPRDGGTATIARAAIGLGLGSIQLALGIGTHGTLAGPVRLRVRRDTTTYPFFRMAICSLT